MRAAARILKADLPSLFLEDPEVCAVAEIIDGEMGSKNLTEADIAEWIKARAKDANFHGMPSGTVSVCYGGSHVQFSLMVWTGETHIHASGDTLAEAQAALSKKADPAARAAALRAEADKILAQAESHT